MTEPYPKRELIVHALDPILRSDVTERRPLAPASRLVLDEAKLRAILASHPNDPSLTFAGHTDLALDAGQRAEEIEEGHARQLAKKVPHRSVDAFEAFEAGALQLPEARCLLLVVAAYPPGVIGPREAFGDRARDRRTEEPVGGRVRVGRRRARYASFFATGSRAMARCS